MIKLNTINKSILSLIINMVYALYNVILGFYTTSWWFITLAAYYIILSVMRFSIVYSYKKHKDNNGLFIKRFTGIMLIILSIVLIGTVTLTIVNKHGTEYHKIAMITIALFSFVKITLAIINLIKESKRNTHIFKALRSISLADAITTIFSLQTSMLVSFEKMAQSDIDLFNLLTGCGACIIVMLLGINLVLIRRTKMAESKFVKANKKIAETVTEGYKTVENAVVNGYKTVEKTVVNGYEKVENKFVEKYLTEENETIEEAKQRLKNNNK